MGPRDVVNIARCPEHGLHGCRETCFVCGVSVEQVPMVPDTLAMEALNRVDKVRIRCEQAIRLADDMKAKSMADKLHPSAVAHITARASFALDIINLLNGGQDEFIPEIGVTNERE